MKITLDLPDETSAASLTLITQFMGGINTFIHCFCTEDGKTVRVTRYMRDGKPFYCAEEET